MSTDCARFISQGEVVSGGNDGALQVWNQLRKKPLSVIHTAHGFGATQLHGGPSAGCAAVPLPGAPASAAASVPDVTGWVQSVAVCSNSDLVASGVWGWQQHSGLLSGTGRCRARDPTDGEGLHLSAPPRCLPAHSFWRPCRMLHMAYTPSVGSDGIVHRYAPPPSPLVHTHACML